VGRAAGVHDFYKSHFIGKWPADTEVVPVPRTVGEDQVADEFVVRFTHDREIPVLLPGIRPTGKKVELAHVVVMRFEDGKIAHEHIYWDQASLLAQMGLLDPAQMPAVGVEQARKLLAKSVPQARNPAARTPPATPPLDLAAVFDAHLKLEFMDIDVEATMKTMTAAPYVFNVPTASGGDGYAGVRRFYTEQFVGKMPAGTRVVPVSRTVGKDRVVDELILAFTHDVPISFMLAGVPPTGKKVELPHVVIMEFDGDKVAHEHIDWDQESLLVQVGLVDPTRLPAVGTDQARWLQDRSPALTVLLRRGAETDARR
jgi:carboxymethylenebutenolidase